MLRFTEEQSVSLHTHRDSRLADMHALIPPAPMEEAPDAKAASAHADARWATEGGIANDVKHKRKHSCIKMSF